MKQLAHAASTHSCSGVYACPHAVPLVLSASAMQPPTLNVVSAESVSRAPVLLGVLPLVGLMHPMHVAFVVSVNQALHVVDVAVDEAHAVTKAEMSVGVQAPSCWTGATNAGTSELETLVRGVGHVGPVPPLLEPLLLPLLLPELDPDPEPELDPEEPPEPEPDELPEPEPEPDEPPELDPAPPPLLDPDPPPLPEPDPPPLPDPEPLPPPLPEDEPAQAWLAARMHPPVSVHEAHVNVCEPTA